MDMTVVQLLGTTHLNAINGYVKVPKLDMHGLAMRGMSGVISLSAAAVGLIFGQSYSR
jgi:hypothetical protein